MYPRRLHDRSALPSSSTDIWSHGISCICQVCVSQMVFNQLTLMQTSSISSQLSGCEMRTDSDYSRSWHDLRRREFLYWFFVLSYVPGILLVIVLLNAFEPHLPEHLGVYFSIIWLAGFAWTGLYRQSFRCPRCHHYFFRRLGFADPYARTCLNCNLTCWAPGP